MTLEQYIVISILLLCALPVMMVLLDYWSR